MVIRNIKHKGLKRLFERNDPAKLDPKVVPKLIRMLTFLQDMESQDELATIPNWKAHKLTGQRKGTWSLHVSKNWRLTFQIDDDEIYILT